MLLAEIFHITGNIAGIGLIHSFILGIYRPKWLMQVN